MKKALGKSKSLERKNRTELKQLRLSLVNREHLPPTAEDIVVFTQTHFCPGPFSTRFGTQLPGDDLLL
jgi:hypothetical protein